MRNAVIYARYSSDRQNETSIEGQIEECRRYAMEHDLLVVQEYIDRAQTATTDRRPNFLRMISDSENGSFEVILVYQLDRFSRNKDDSGYYKKILARHGVKVVSAKEMISEDSAEIITEGMPRLISDELFDDVQEVLGDKAHHGHRPAIEDYILTGKLYCGHCRDLMKGTSGTSHTGKTHRYYTCSNAPKKCDKKNVRKEDLEPLVLDTCRGLLTDEVIDSVVAAVEEQNRLDQESPAIIRIKGDIKDIEKKIEKLLNQIEEGTGSARISERLKKREDGLEILKRGLKKEETRQLKIDPALVRSFLESLRNYSRDDLSYQKMLIKAFVDRIYLYDDHFTILLSHSGRKGKATKNEVREVEKYFDRSSSTTAEYGVPTRICSFDRRLHIFFYENGLATFASPLISLVSFVNLSSMPNFHNDNNYFCISYFSKDPIVAHSVSPILTFVPH